MENMERQMIHDSAMDMKEMFDKPMEELKEKLKFFGLPDIPNVFITYNNKVNDMVNLFDEKGISLMVKSDDGKTATYNPCLQAFDHDMMSKVFIVNNAMMFIFSILKERYDQIYKNRGVAFLKGVWEIINKRPPFLKQEVLAYIHSLLSRIKDIDKQIYDYDVHKDLYSSIVSYVKVNYKEDDWSDAIERDFVPTLEKLGFDDIITKLKEDFGESTQSYAERIKELEDCKTILLEDAQEDYELMNSEQFYDPEVKQHK